MQRLLAGALALLAATGCVTRTRTRPAPYVPPVAVLDPATVHMLQSCAQREAAPPPSSGADAFAAVAHKRAELVGERAAIEAATAALASRIDKARIATLALSRSDRESATIARALLELQGGRDPSATLPERVRKHEAYRDLAEAHAEAAKLRARGDAIEAQADVLEQVFVALAVGAPPPVPAVALPAPPASQPDGRRIGPGLW